MTGTTAQFISLVSHGNALLRGFPIAGFFPGNSSFQYCDSVTFVEVSKNFFGKVKETVVAQNPIVWLEQLNRSAAGLKLSWSASKDQNISDRMSVAFVGGGGTWTLEVVGKNGRSALWLSRWDVGNQNAPDRKIWRVTYGRVAEIKSSTGGQNRLNQIEEEFRASLQEIREFALQNDCAGFAEYFLRALSALDGQSDHAKLYHRDLVPSGLIDPRPARLLEACQFAWVFGGMGSWNDLVFEGETERTYNRVSERLFRAIHEAIPAASNETFKQN